jgi:hypothetical protein
MSSKFVYHIALLGILLSFSCAAAENPNERKAVLAIGESAKAPDTNATVFVEGVEDSRCPKGVSCFWEGDAVVKIRIEMPNASPSNYTLHTNKRFSGEIEHGGVRIALISVTPYPDASATPRREEYRITISFERK